jgi:hypothetical protein
VFVDIQLERWTGKWRSRLIRVKVRRVCYFFGKLDAFSSRLCIELSVAACEWMRLM